MAENETLDSVRWKRLVQSMANGDSVQLSTEKARSALYGGLKKALQQFQEAGISLGDLIRQDFSREALGRVLRQTKAHEYATQLQDAVSLSRSGLRDRLTAWLNGVLDSALDRVAVECLGGPSCQVADSLHERLVLVRQSLQPDIERIVENLVADPEWRPKQPSVSRTTDPTAELMNLSLRAGAC